MITERYTPCDCTMMKSPYGSFVKTLDHQEALAEKDREIAELKSKLEANA